ncbi:MAG: response regulator [Bacteroidales bacterium]|nr:response regulator [Bacteroidales bacterium]
MRALIVDDIFTNRLLLAEILRNMGIEFDEVENGKEAIQAIEKEEYDLVLMDIEMPVMNGLETTKYIREKLPYPKNQTFVVALTAHNPQLFFEDFKDVGFNQLLTKPYNVDKINSLVEEVKG